MTDDASMATDGLLVSHIRYQGFQGNIRVSTKPMSFDQNALEQLLQLPEIAAWRTNKGIIVSDDLGSQAVRMFFDPVMRTFDARQVARDAFLAGNDLLYMDNFVASGDRTNTQPFFAHSIFSLKNIVKIQHLHNE